MFIQSVREKLKLWWELSELKKTAAEKVIHLEVAHLHDALVALETKLVILEVNEAKKLRDHLKAGGHDITQIDAAIGVTEKAQTAVEAANKGEPAEDGARDHD